MKIIATADTHGHLPEFPGSCDLAIFAGDVCPDQAPKWQLRWLEEEWQPYLRSLPAKHVVWIWGNHDFIGDPESRPESIIPSNFKFLYEDKHIHHLNCSSVDIEGLRIYGYPYVGGLPGWAFNRDDNEREWMANGIPRCDILVAHAPMYGQGDKTMGGYFVGDPYLAANIERIKPKLYICGHIHEGFGSYKNRHVEEGVFVVSYCDHHYIPRNERGLVTIDLP